MKTLIISLMILISLPVFGQRQFYGKKTSGGGGAVTQVAYVDSVTIELTPSGVDGSWSTTFTATAGQTNPVIFVDLIQSGSSRTDHITVNGSAATQMSDSVDQRHYAWYYKASLSGTVTIAGHSNNTDKVIVHTGQLKGVNQTTPIGTIAKGSQGYGSNVTCNVTLATGDLAISVYHGWTNDGSPTAPMTASSTYTGTSALGKFGIRTGNASVACEWTFSAQAADEFVIPFKIN
jgi:hypothetical protein